ncbi:MAG TPA: (2Fe-2S)-binding protein [Longimicrobiales bacterium]|nr:(2Fe-2S)-binding protein [Longimicrobiales bacterium]
MRRFVSFFVNGKPVDLEVDPRRRLLWVLRTELGLTGTKYGCGEQHCGACTVLIDGSAALACGVRMSSVSGKEVTTVEGLADGDRLHPVQQAFADHDALQCGFCTPGLVMGAVGLLGRNPSPDEDEIREGLERHLCRCGTHVRVLQAVQTASRVMREEDR